MKKLLKFSVFFIVIITVIAALSLLTLYLTTDPDVYKNKIADAVRKSTGRELAIKGNVELSVFPWLGLEVGEITLGNAPAFGDAAMAKINAADIRLRLIPLLHKEAVIRKIVLNGLELNLIRKKDGTTNWDDLVKSSASETAESHKDDEGKSDESVPRQEPGNEGGIAENLRVAGAELTEVNIRFDDQMQGALYQINHLNLRTGELKLGTPCDADLQFHIDISQPKISADVEFTTLLNLAIAENRVLTENTELKLAIAEFSPESGAETKTSDNISGTIHLAVDSLAANWEKSSVDADNLNLKTELQSSQMPAAANNLDIKGNIAFNWKAQTLSLKELNISEPAALDLRGSLSLEQFENPKIRFDLSANELVLDQYLPPASGQKVSETENQKSKIKNQKSSLPELNGTLRIARFQFQDKQLSDIYLNITPKPDSLNDISLKTHLAMTRPELLAAIDVKTTLGLRLESQQAVLNNTHLTAEMEKFKTAENGILSGTANLNADLQIDWGNNSLKTKQVSLTSSITGKPIPEGKATVSLKADTADLNWKTERLNIVGLDMSAYDIRLTGNTTGTRLFSSPETKSDVAVSEFSPKSMMKRLGLALPETKDPAALTSVKGNLRLLTAPNSLTVSGLNLQVDQTLINGFASVSDFKKPDIKFDLKLGETDVDRYLPPKSEKSEDSQEDTQEDTGKDSEKTENPLRHLLVDGSLTADKLKIYNVQTENLMIKVAAKNGVFQIDPFFAKLYKGEYAGKIKADFNPKIPRTELNLTLSSVQMGELLKSIAGKENLNGDISANLNLAGGGNDWKALCKTLKGQGAFSLKNGMIQGFQIIPDEVITQILANNLKKQLISRSQAGVWERVSRISKQQKFKDIDGKFDIHNGIVRSQDFSLTADKLLAAGEGTINLAAQEIDYHIKADINGIPVIPFHVRGPFSNIKASLDTTEFVKGMAAEVITSPVKVGAGVLDIGTKMLDKGKDAIGEGSGAKNVGKGMLDIGKGILDAGKGALEAGEGVESPKKSDKSDKKDSSGVEKGAKNVGKGVTEAGKGVLDVGKGTVEIIGGGLKNILGGDRAEKDNNTPSEKDK